MKKTSLESKIVMSEIMMPFKANTSGNIHGGEIMKLMDTTAYASARRYAHTNIVTARVDEMEFHQSTAIGDLVVCTAQVVFTGKTSMEVMVIVDVEELDCEGCDCRKRALSAFFTMVSLDKDGKPSLVPELILNTPEEKALYQEGKERYERYKAKRGQKSKYIDMNGGCMV